MNTIIQPPAEYSKGNGLIGLRRNAQESSRPESGRNTNTAKREDPDPKNIINEIKELFYRRDNKLKLSKAGKYYIKMIIKSYNDYGSGKYKK